MPLASHLIPEDGAVPAAEGGVAGGSHGVAAPELAAHDVGIGNVPAIVTHCPPRPLLLQLHPALAAAPAARQPERSGTWEDAPGKGELALSQNPKKGT